jgi:hypothetical protein
VRLSLGKLSGLYLVIPLCFGIWAFDVLVLGGALRPALPRTPEAYALFELVFGWPHIVASTLILVTTPAYLRAYRRRLTIASVAVTTFFGVGFFVLPYDLLFFVAATATIVHVLKQQIGIGRGAARTSSRLYTAWGWTAIGAGVVLYNALFLTALDPYKAWLVAGAAAFATATVILAIRLRGEVAAGLGRRFLIANTAMVVSALFFYAAGYGIFAIAIPRVVHDATAFAFYVSHDVNKHRDGARNALYRGAARLPGGVWWVTPALAVVVAWLLAEHGDAAFHALTGGLLADAAPRAISLGLLGFLGMMHYYYESFTWKSGSPYRTWIAMGS